MVAAAQGYLPEGVTINCTAPGPTPTEGKNWTRAMEAMGKPQGMWRSFLFWMLNHREVSMGIQGMLTLMGSPVMEGVTGHLLDTGFGTYRPSVCLHAYERTRPAPTPAEGGGGSAASIAQEARPSREGLSLRTTCFSIQVEGT